MAHKRAMRPPVEVEIDGLDADGIGTGLDDQGRRWTIRGAIPGGRVLAGGRPHGGALLGELRAPAGAVAPQCPQFGTCGGCLYQPLPPASQRHARLAALTTLLAPLGVEDPAMRATPGEGYGYRNRLELSFGVERYRTRDEQAAEKVERAAAADAPAAAADAPAAATDSPPNTPPRFLGFHGPGRFDRIVDTPACAIAAPELNAVLARVRADVLDSPFPAWNPRTQTGFWRQLGLRGGKSGVLVLVYTALASPEAEVWLRLHAPRWGARGVLWYTTDRVSDAAVGELREVLAGDATLDMSLDGVPMTLSPLAFFQVNPAGAEVLLDVIRDALGPGGLLLDLYCGVGALGLALHRSFEAIAGVDLVAEGIAEARRNAEALGVRADYRAGRAELVLPDLLRDHGATATTGRRLAVLVDPPRAGLHPDALTLLSGVVADVLVYVACRPTSLLRDGLALLAAGWRCTSWTAVDLFPHTAHVEVVARFVRAPATLATETAS
ncbi:MAG: class I SAM-dependent RNA methyltransferase [Myxococcales bacterium]|nr:class I SAM-dependent RNA methyltransferase [Myxococcales bacterium]